MVFEILLSTEWLSHLTAQLQHYPYFICNCESRFGNFWVGKPKIIFLQSMCKLIIERNKKWFSLLSLKATYIRQALLLRGSCSLDLHRLSTATFIYLWMHFYACEYVAVGDARTVETWLVCFWWIVSNRLLCTSLAAEEQVCLMIGAGIVLNSCLYINEEVIYGNLITKSLSSVNLPYLIWIYP